MNLPIVFLGDLTNIDAKDKTGKTWFWRRKELSILFPKQLIDTVVVLARTDCSMT